jgi:hypothetical protein
LLGSVSERVHKESDLHARFAADRLHGEWFRPSDAILAFIRENATNG